MINNKNIKVIFLGTPNFAIPTLNKLINSGFSIPLVISQPDRPVGRGHKLTETPVKTVAKENNLNVYQPNRISKDIELINTLKELEPDLMVTAAFGQILSQEIIDIPKWGIWNVHASLLPRWRGAAPINWAILEGDKETGVTIMKTEKGLDTGPMLHKRSVPIDATDNAVILAEKLSELGAEALEEAINLKLQGELVEEKQDDSKTTYASKLTKEMSLIDWNTMSAFEVDRKVKGLNPWPGTVFQFEDKQIKLIEANIFDENSLNSFEVGNIRIGEVFKINKKQVLVRCKEGFIELVTVQPPNKNKIKGFEWIND
ncbi:MAG: methionyl-tRNA formyltransferase [Candidatus Caenarcaniphilales bacterium]|nr:methionyl-tRNA formyltransferase [Candidatus Caenarcaniphilales bacterium]